MADENGERPKPEGFAWARSCIDDEIARREAFGSALGEAWAKIPAIRAAADFSEFCEMISQCDEVWAGTDFIILSAAWKAIQAAPSNVGRAR